ncbi:MAG: hypothetical protein GY861_03305 [bacterium]|nr:hypothetical protein [bacterium]
MASVRKRKKRIKMMLTEYLKNGEKRVVSRLLPSRMRDLIKESKAEKMSVRVIYKTGIENESVVSSDKKYLLSILSIFTAKEEIEDALTY